MKSIEMKLSACILVLCASSCLSLAADAKRIPASQGFSQATSVSSLFADGLKASSVTITYTKPLQAESVSVDDYRIEGRIINSVNVKGKEVTLTLDCSNKWHSDPNWRPGADGLPFEKSLTVTQVGDVTTSNGKTIFSGSYSISTPEYEIPEDCRKFSETTFNDLDTSIKLKYSIYMPTNYADGWNYPLVVFIPDSSCNTNTPKTQLLAGYGGTIWATEQEQSKHKAVVVAIHYTKDQEKAYGPLVTENGEMTKGLTSIYNLICYLRANSRVDNMKVYGIGQGEGASACMILSENHPDTFAAQYLVAPQIMPKDISTLKDQNMWVTVCTGDKKAFSRMNAAIDQWDADGSVITTAEWNPNKTESAQQIATYMAAERAPINYLVIKGGHHQYTWTLTYQTEAIRDWIFRQSAGNSQNAGQ